jgi:hypothetical protein
MPDLIRHRGRRLRAEEGRAMLAATDNPVGVLFDP